VPGLLRPEISAIFMDCAHRFSTGANGAEI